MRGARQRSDTAVIRGIIYWALIYAVGFALGTVRILLVVPLLGERAAELIELPVMLVATYFAARFVTQRFKATRRVEYLHSGLVALGLLLLAEAMFVVGILGLSITDYIAKKDPVAGAAYVVALIIYMGMPWLVGKTRDGSCDKFRDESYH